MPKMKIKKSDLSFHVFCLFDLDSPSHADLGLSYRSIEIHIFILIFWEPKMEVKDLEAQINFRYKNFPNGQQKEKAQIHTFF